MTGLASVASAGAAVAPVGAPAPGLCLQDLAGFLAEGESLADWLGEATRAIRTALAARCCAVRLLSGDGGTPALALAASSAAAGAEMRPAEADLADAVVHNGNAMVRECRGEEGTEAQPAGPSHGALAVPMLLNGRVLGVLCVSGPEGKEAFGAGDLSLAATFAGLLARVVQAAQLQKILDQRFAQIALAESGRRHAGIMQKAMPPDRAAQIVARSLFRQMTRAGFSDKQVIRTASEILDELNRSLRRSAARPPSS